MSRTNRSNARGAMIGVLTLLLLALLAAGLWYASTLLNKPLRAEGASNPDGYRQLSSIYGNGPDRLYRPIEVDVDTDGNIYTADSFKHRIVQFDSNGKFVRAIGGPGNIQGKLQYPFSVKVDDRGRVYVASANGRIVIYGPDGKLLRFIPVPTPTTIEVTKDRLYVATSKGILIGDLDGNQVGQLLSAGKGKGQIDKATSLAIDTDGTIYIADSMNYRVQAVDKNGKFLWEKGAAPNPKTAVTDRSRDFGLPTGLILGSDDLLYLIDAFAGQIVVMSKEGEVLASYGDWGRQDGQFYYPSSIAEVTPEKFVVADTFNNRLQLVRIPTRNPDLTARGKQMLPWLVGLALLGLLGLLLRRPVAVVIDEAGLRRAAHGGRLEDLVAHSSALYVPDGTAEAVADLIQAADGLEDVLREVELDIDEGADMTIEIALGMRGRLGLRRVAIAFPSTPQAELAREHRIGILEEASDAVSTPVPAEANL